MSCEIVTIERCLRRGDSVEVTDQNAFVVKIPGRDLTTLVNSTIWFTAKKNNTPTTAREISRSNKQSEYPLVITLNGSDTDITIPIIPEDTQDLQVAPVNLPCDIQISNDLDTDDVETIAIGELEIQPDVRTIFDDYDLTEVETTFQQVNASDFEVDEMLIVANVDGVRTMVPITIDELKILLGI